MGRWGQGIFENDCAGDTLLKFLDTLVIDLETQIDEEENSVWAYPESSLATAFILWNITTATQSANFCTCDAKLWRERTENNLRTFGVKHCDGNADLSYPAAQEALKLFDDLYARALEHDGECDCGGEWLGVFVASQENSKRANKSS